MAHTNWTDRYEKAALHSLPGESKSDRLEKLQDALGLGEKYRNEEYKRWSLDQAFMSMAYSLAKCSHDSDTQHGCVIVDENNHIVSSGFNGFLPGAPDEILPNTREGGFKYRFIVHSEANACAHATRANLKGCRVFVTGYPCNECMKTMINKGIREIIVGDIGHKFEDGYWELHHFLVNVHGVTIRQFQGEIVDTSSTRFINSIGA